MSCISQPFEVKFASLGPFLLGRTLGKGYNSKVKLGYEPSTDQYYAVKIVKHSDADLDCESLSKEIDILSDLNNPNIVNLIDFHKSVDYVKKNGESYKVIAIVMEYVSGGEVFDYVKISGRFSEEVTRFYFRSLIEGLDYCHKKGIAHRDLKLENLLFDEYFNLKIADFGFATEIMGKNGFPTQLKTYLGTESYMAPEIINKKPYSGTAVDVFACGVILFIMMNGNPPFLKADPHNDYYYQFLAKDRQEEFWSGHERLRGQHQPDVERFFSDEFRDLINAMLAVNPKHRPTLEQIKAHPWYNGSTPDLDDLQNEFYERKLEVTAELQQQKEAMKKERMLARMETFEDTGASTEGRPYY